MRFIDTEIPDVKMIDFEIFHDARGYFLESYHEKDFHAAGITARFAQTCQSYSTKNVLRGLHYQIKNPQGKLLYLVKGKILDVAVDLRRSSATFGRHVKIVLSDDALRAAWIPEGFAHGFLTLSSEAYLSYQVTHFYTPLHERVLLWNDPALAIDWQSTSPILSEKDQKGKHLSALEVFE